MRTLLYYLKKLQIKIVFSFGILILFIQTHAAITVKRHLEGNLLWSSCNEFNFCYHLKAEAADIGLFMNRFYSGPIEISIFKKQVNGNETLVRIIKAKEALWNYHENYWVLNQDGIGGATVQIRIMPDYIKE